MGRSIFKIISMSRNMNLRWFLLAPIVVALLVVISPVVSWASEVTSQLKGTVDKVINIVTGEELKHKIRKLAE